MQHMAQQINGLIHARRIGEAELLCQKLILLHPDFVDGWIQAARICHMKNDCKGMFNYAQTAVKLAPNNFVALLQEVEANLLCAHTDIALDKLTHLEKAAANDAKILQHTGEFYSHAGQYDAAMRCYQQAHTIIGDDAELLYNTSVAAIALGQISEAERLLDKVIAKNPHDYDAYYNRATFRKQTLENNHIEEMQTLLKSSLKSLNGEVQLGFALSKELEDIGHYAESFAYLKKGADRRKAMLSYDVQDDVKTISEIQRVMDNEFFEDLPETSHEAGPIFILGMPRSGTTLVDRILSSHSEVTSLGEINDFAIAMMNLVPNAGSKMDLIGKTAHLDFQALGDAYLKSTKARESKSLYLIDKTPANFLYIGLIAKALPGAKIIHLRRNPMDSCYAMYKTLFRMGYPFSYNLEDLGAYYVAYRGLMAHWRTQLPGRLLDMDYEALIENQEAQSKRLIAHCNLAWEPSCLDFHKNKSASATASAGQVRQPIYSSSVEKWRLYENELQPLRKYLEAADIDIEASGSKQGKENS